MRFAWFFALVLWPIVAPSQLTSREKAILTDAAFIENLSVGDLSMDRLPGLAQTLPGTREFGRDPMALLEFNLALLSASPWAALASLEQAAFGSEPKSAAAQPVDPAGLPESLALATREVILELVAAIVQANREIKASLAKLSTDDKRLLLESLASWAADGAKVEFVRQRPLPLHRMKALADQVDFMRIVRAGQQLRIAVERAKPRLNGALPTELVPLKFTVEATLVVLGGPGNDAHEDRDAMLTIDVGGDDRYRGRHGAGIGYASVLIDLGGNDTYEGADANFGFGLLGIGLAYDDTGDDQYRVRSLALGSAVAGYGFFADAAGKDDFRAETFALGSAAFGEGVALDFSGSDRYEVAGRGVGFGLFQGLGVWGDSKGDDTVRTGVGYAAASESDFMAAGWAVAVDYAGDDVVFAGTGVGLAYTGGVALVADGAGDDVRHSKQDGGAYAQSGGATVLCDLGGNDQTTVSNGYGLASASDNGLAICFDRTGDDLYVGKGAMRASGLSGGTGILLDSSGNDRYEGVFSRDERGEFGFLADFDGINHFSAPNAADRSDVSPAKDQTPKVGSVPNPGERALAVLWDDFDLVKLVEIGVPAAEFRLKQFSEDRFDRSEMDVMRLAVLVQVTGTRSRVSGYGNSLNILRVAAQSSTPGFQDQVFLGLDDPKRRLTAIKLAGINRMSEAVPKLLPLTLDPSGEIAVAAAKSLAEIGEAGWNSTAEALIRARDPRLRSIAFDYLSSDAKRATEAAERLVVMSEEQSVRWGVRLLAAAGKTTEVEAYFRDKRPGVKVSALQALEGKFTETGRTALLELTTDADPRVRWVAKRIDPGR